MLRSGLSKFAHGRQKPAKTVRSREIGGVRQLVARAVQQGAREKSLTHLAPWPVLVAATRFREIVLTARPLGLWSLGLAPDATASASGVVSACTRVRGGLDHQGARGQPSRTGMAIAVRNGSRSASPAPKMVSANIHR
eukprot:COSAG01_NODE_10993_length_2030_cov_12.392025_2_plen_138_part_00